MTAPREKSELMLKWGTVKGWSGFYEGEPPMIALEKWAAISGVSGGAATHDNTDAHRAALCEVVDAVDLVYYEWDGRYMSKDEAKAYIMGYRK